MIKTKLFCVKFLVSDKEWHVLGRFGLYAKSLSDTQSKTELIRKKFKLYKFRKQENNKLFKVF